MTSHRRPLIEAEFEYLVAIGLSQRPYDPGLRRDWRLFVIVIAADHRSGGALLGGRRRAIGDPSP